MSLPADPHEIYLGFDPGEDEPRAAKHRLVKELKRAVDDAALIDPTPAGRDELEALADAVAGLPHAALVERSPVSGRSNPIAPPLHLEMSEGITRAWAVWSDAYEGPPGCLHGGFVAAAFDDLMGLAQMASGKAGYTGTLTVKMIKPTPLFQRIDYEAWLDRVEGRKIWCKATARRGDELLGEAEIVFISPATGVIPGTEAFH